MKKTILILLLILVAFMFFGCGQQEQTEVAGSNVSTTEKENIENSESVSVVTTDNGDKPTETTNSKTSVDNNQSTEITTDADGQNQKTTESKTTANVVETTNDSEITENTKETFFVVSFKDYNGDILKEEKVKKGEDATAPEPPKRDGYIFVKWEYKFYKPELKSIFITIKGSTNVFINNIAPNLYNSFSVVLLGIYSTSIQNGIYDAGKKFTTIIYNFMNIFTRVFFPYFSRKSQGYKVYAISSILLSVFLVALIIILAPFLINIFFGSEFADSVIILRITAVSLIFLMIDSVFGINFLLVKGYDKVLRNITIVSSIIGFLLAFPLVKYFSAIGVAVVYTFTSALIGVGSMIYACKIKKKNRCI